jgi:endonuclease/exonuclease/phosphatase (EEP) superfamily protein YafD
MNDSPGNPTPRGRKRLGRSLVIGIVLLAAAAWQVFRLVRRPETRPLPSVPAGVVAGVPTRPLRFAAYNIYHNYRGMDGTVTEVRKVDPPPDFLLLSEVERQHVAPMGDALAMRYRYFPLLRHSPGQPAWPDVAILSRHRLYEGRVLCTADGHPFGLWAYAVVDDRKFAVAGVHLWPTFGIDPRHVIETANMRHRQLEVMLTTWREAGAPPLVVAGDFNQPALGENYALMTRDLTDTLASLGQTGATFGKRLLQVRIDYVLATPQWQPLTGGVIQGNASDHRPVWVDVKGADDGAATRRAGA